MKNRANINFILAMVLVAGLVVFMINLGSLSSKLGSGLQGIEESMSIKQEADSVENAEDYGLILEGIGYGLGTVANVALLVVNSLIGIYAFLLFFFALLARLVYAGNGGRLVAYRIFMTVEYLLQLLLIGLLIYSLMSVFVLKVFVLTLLISAGLIFSAMNTYSPKIYKI